MNKDQNKTTFTWESFSDGCDDFRAKLRKTVREANINTKDKCQKCGSELTMFKYGMGFENDVWKCGKCGHVHESNKSTWIDIDGTEHEVML